VDLVDEHDGSPLAQPDLVLRLLDDFSHVADGRAGGRQGNEASPPLPFALVGDDVSQSGLETEETSIRTRHHRNRSS